MKVILIIIGLLFIGLLYSRMNKIQKQKELKWTSKMAFPLLITGLLLVLSGCADSFDENDSTDKATEEHVETVEIEKPEEKAPAEDSSKKENEKTETENSSNSATAIEKNSATTGKPASAKKTETSGTTAQVPVKLVKTIDGDTIKVLYNGQEINVRYLLIDTPETSHPRLGKQPFGEEAKERNRQLVNSGALTLEFDIGERIDKYDRLLAYVYVDGKSVQETLLAEGLARVAYVYPPNTRHLTPFEEVQAGAKKKGLGIWSVEDYATDSGFNSDVVPVTKPSSSTAKSPTTPSTPSVNVADGQEWFKNCTELRKKYPNGVPEGHAAYQSKMDRDKDGYACEK